MAGPDVSFFRWRGTVLSRVWLSVLLYMLYAAGWVQVYIMFFEMHDQGTRTSTTHLVPVLAVVLGCLLGVRTSGAYERYSEGCRCWSSIIVTTRNFMRHMLYAGSRNSSVEDGLGSDSTRNAHHRAANLLLAFSLSVVQHLREEITDNVRLPSEAQRQLHGLLPDHLRREATAFSAEQENLPLAIINDLHIYVGHMNKELGVIDGEQTRTLLQLLNTLADALASMERIKRTPVPFAYTVHLRQIITLYCLALPAQLVRALHWWLVPMVGVTVLTFVGIEAIGSEIENPFGKDFNDLPSEEYCCKISEEMARMLRGGAAGQAREDAKEWTWSSSTFINGRERMDPPSLGMAGSPGPLHKRL